MVGRAPGGNGCPGSLEVTALRWLRGHSWLNSWFLRGDPPRSVGPAVTTPRQGPPLETTLACLGHHRVPPPPSLRHVPSSAAKSSVLSLSYRLSSFLPFASISSYLHLSLAQSSLALLYISFARAFPRNLLISSVFRVFSLRRTPRARASLPNSSTHSLASIRKSLRTRASP